MLNSPDKVLIWLTLNYIPLHYHVPQIANVPAPDTFEEVVNITITYQWLQNIDQLKSLL